MNQQEAHTLITNATGLIQATRQDHIKIQEALEVLRPKDKKTEK